MLNPSKSSPAVVPTLECSAAAQRKKIEAGKFKKKAAKKADGGTDGKT
jgi:hypothetical protein